MPCPLMTWGSGARLSLCGSNKYGTPVLGPPRVSLVIAFLSLHIFYTYLVVLVIFMKGSHPPFYCHELPSWMKIRDWPPMVTSPELGESELFMTMSSWPALVLDRIAGAPKANL